MLTNDIEIERAKKEALNECKHCWHSKSDKDADNHKATCCLCLAKSVPTEGVNYSHPIGGK